MWFQTKTKVKTKTWAGDQPPPAGRPRDPGKRTRREDHALLIVRDEFRTGYSSIGLLASIPRLRFTGTCDHKTMDGQRKTDYHRTVLRLFPRVSPKGFTPGL